MNDKKQGAREPLRIVLSSLHIQSSFFFFLNRQKYTQSSLMRFYYMKHKFHHYIGHSCVYIYINLNHIQLIDGRMPI